MPKIKVSVTLTIKGQEVTLSPVELRELRDELDKLVAKQAVQYPLPDYPNETIWPRITYEVGDVIPNPMEITC